MFTPPDPSTHRTILFVCVLALLAHLCALTRVVHGAERFVPPASTADATLQLRGEATVAGDEITVRQLARWSEPDRSTLDPIGDLIVTRFEPKAAVRDISVDEVKRFLADAGVNVSALNFVGPVACRVSRGDAVLAPGVELEQTVAADDGRSPAVAAPAEVAGAAARSLKQVLTADVSDRLNLKPDQLQVTFAAADEALLRLTEAHTAFEITPQRAGNLGDVSWVVTCGGKRHFLTASAKAWQNQVVVTHTLLARDTITDADLTDSRRLVDRLGDDALLARDQIVGQSAARDLQAGTVLTARLVTPVELIRVGQDVTIDTVAGGISLKTVARALQSGTLGQTVRLRNEATDLPIDAVVTGPQTACLTTTKAITRAVR